MRLNNTAIENINKIYDEKNACRFIKMTNLKVYDSLGGTSIINCDQGNWEVVKLADLDQMIKSLTAMKEAIEEATGIIA